MASNCLTHTKRELMMHLESERLKSFENWPFDDSCKCTPTKVCITSQRSRRHLFFLARRPGKIVPRHRTYVCVFCRKDVTPLRQKLVSIKWLVIFDKFYRNKCGIIKLCDKNVKRVFSIAFLNLVGHYIFGHLCSCRNYVASTCELNCLCVCEKH